MELMNSKWVKSNLVFYGTHKSRWLKAFGPNVVSFEMPRCGTDQDNTTNDPTWGKCTIVETSTTTTQVAGLTQGVGLTVTTANKEYDGLNIQAHGDVFQFSAGQPLYFGIKMALADATNTSVYAGMMTTNTATFAAAANTLHAGTTSHAGFYKLDAVTATKYIGEKAGAVSSSSAGTMDTSAHVYELLWDGNSTLASGIIKFWVDGVEVGSVGTANITTGLLRPTFAFRAGGSAAEVAHVHWMRAIQIQS